MRFLIFIYGKSRMKRTQLVSDKRAECHILLPKDDFSLERTVFLQFKNISGEWFIKETDCCHLKTEEFFQMGKRKSDEGIFYKLSIGRKNELSVGGKDLYIQLIRYRNDWSIYKKYKLRDCRIIKEKNIFIMMEKAINRKNSMGISYEYGKWFIEKCGNIEIYINEILLEKKQQLEFGDVICIGTIYLLFFENYIAVEAGERNIVSDYLEEVVLENEIKGQEDVRKKEKREITFHRAPRVMEELKKVSLKVDAPPQVDVQEKKSIFMDIGTIMNLMFPMLGMNLFLIYGMKSEQNQAGIYVYSGLFMAVMSAVCSILWLMISRKYEKREQQKKVNKERLAYRRYLNKKSEYIKVQYERVYKVLQSRYLRADTYLDSPLLDMYLWNRNLYHKDFLMYRIGIGDVEFPMKIEFPEEVFGDEENILWREAKKIKEHYEILHQIPVLLDMGRYSQIGIITKDTIAGMELVRSIILQIALCNCYTEVKIGCIYNKNKVIQSQQWDFCRWLPHIWDANRQKRFIAGNEVEARRLFYDLLQIFKEREEVSISGKAEKILPHYILFVAEEQFLEGEMFSKYILDRGREYGLTVVWLDSMRKKLPNTCKMVLEINGGFTGRYEIERHSQKKEKINFDYTEKNIAEKLIRSISGIKVMEIEEKAGIPEVVDFLGMYDVHTIEELHIKQRWEKNRIFESAKVLIGKKAGDAVILLDLINSVCEEGTVIEIFQKHNALGYAEFSYALGLGYFYDMGNITGKGASEKWFCEAIDTMTSQDENEAFGKQKRKRAGLYAKIANYYNTFLLNGTDQSGERGTGDFMDFYKTLHSLNQFEVTQKSTKSDLAAAYLISREITIEIMNYAEQFLKDSSINKKMLNKELEKIEERTKYFIKEKKQMEELYQFMNEAKQKIEIADSFKDKEDVRDAGGT